MEVTQITVDGLTDPSGRIQYWGKATKQPNGEWHCYANVDGAMCIVAVNITIAYQKTVDPK